RGDAGRQFRCDAGRQLPDNRQSGARRAALSVELPGQLWPIRRPAGARRLRQDAARDRSEETACPDAPVREEHARRPGPRNLPGGGGAHCPPPFLRKRLEDQPEPLLEPGPGHGVARQVTKPLCANGAKEMKMKSTLRLAVWIVAAVAL